MKRFKLSRKEKLLFATPLLLPLLVLAWPLVSADNLDRTLHELAGPNAVDCGLTSNYMIANDPCAIAAFKAGKPFIVRGLVQSDSIVADRYYQWVKGYARTPQGQLYWAAYKRKSWKEKASVRQVLLPNARIHTEKNGDQIILFDGFDRDAVKETRVWW